MEYVNLALQYLQEFWAWSDFNTVGQFWLFGFITNFVSWFIGGVIVTIKMNNCNEIVLKKYMDFCASRAAVIRENNNNRILLSCAMVFVPFHSFMLLCVQIWHFRKPGYNGLVDALVHRDRASFVHLITYKVVDQDNK